MATVLSSEAFESLDNTVLAVMKSTGHKPGEKVGVVCPFGKQSGRSVGNMAQIYVGMPELCIIEVDSEG